MPQVPAEKLRILLQANPKIVSKKLAYTFRQLGYTNVTDEWVETEIRRLLDFNQSKGRAYTFLAWMAQEWN